MRARDRLQPLMTSGARTGPTPARWSQDEYVRAYRFAAQAHQGQLVPGTDIPYLMHLSFVCMEILAALAAGEGSDQDLAVQCALLHDALEDTQTTHEELEHEFGAAVAAGVAALTKNDALPKDLRMTDSLRRIKEQPREVWMVKLADRITNLMPPPADWTADKIARYRAEAEQIHHELGDASPFLSSRFQERLRTYGRHNP
jgi:(p)ppGpp synthase/HD superfamily hydrolase